MTTKTKTPEVYVTRRCHEATTEGGGGGRTSVQSHLLVFPQFIYPNQPNCGANTVITFLPSTNVSFHPHHITSHQITRHDTTTPTRHIMHYTVHPKLSSNPFPATPNRTNVWGAVFNISPLARVGVTVVLILATTLTLSYLATHGTTQTPLSGSTDIDWVLTGIVFGVLIVGVLGAFFPSILPLKEAGEPQYNGDLETFAVNSSMSQLLGVMSTENLLPWESVQDAVALVSSTNAFSVEAANTFPPPQLVRRGDGTTIAGVLLQRNGPMSGALLNSPPPDDAMNPNTETLTAGSAPSPPLPPPTQTGSSKPTTPSSVPLDIPLTQVNEELRSSSGVSQARPSSAVSTNSPTLPTYLFRVWVTVDTSKTGAAGNTAGKWLQHTTTPFHLRYSTTSDGPDSSTDLVVPFRIVTESDTLQRQNGTYRWFHLESSPVTFPTSTHSVTWRVDSTNASLGDRHWFGFDVQRQRAGGASQYIRPGDSMQAMFATYLTTNPFTSNGTSWIDLSGNHNSCTSVNGAEIATQADGSIDVTGNTVLRGPPSWALLGQSSAATSTTNNVTPFTVSFMYRAIPPPSTLTSTTTPSEQKPSASIKTTTTVTTDEPSCSVSPSAPFRTLLTVHATHLNTLQLDNPPNFFFRVQVDPNTNQLRVVQQVIVPDTTFPISSSSSHGSAGDASATNVDTSGCRSGPQSRITERCMYIPLRGNTTKDPVLYTLSVQPSGTQRNKGDVYVYANSQTEAVELAWLDLSYDLNDSGKSGQIIWGDMRQVPSVSEAALTTATSTPTFTPTTSNPFVEPASAESGGGGGGGGGGAARSTTHPLSPASTSSMDSIGSLYAFLIFSRFLNEDDVHQLHTSLFTMYYAGANGTLLPKGNGATCTNSYWWGDGPSMSYNYITPVALVDGANDNIRNMTNMTNTNPTPFQASFGNSDTQATEWVSSSTQGMLDLRSRGSSSSSSSSSGSNRGESMMQQTICNSGPSPASSSSSTSPLSPSSTVLYEDQGPWPESTTATCLASASTRSTNPATGNMTLASGPTFTLRSEYTDAEYDMLTPVEKLNVLQDTTFVREPRSLPPDQSTYRRMDLSWAK